MMKKQRTKAGAWGLPWESKIFGVKRSKVRPPKSDPGKLGEWKRKQTLEALKRHKKERQEEQRRQNEQKRLEMIERKRTMLQAESSYYEAKARKKRAKKSASFQFPRISAPQIKVKKKKQGRKLNGKRRIGLL